MNHRAGNGCGLGVAQRDEKPRCATSQPWILNTMMPNFQNRIIGQGEASRVKAALWLQTALLVILLLIPGALIAQNGGTFRVLGVSVAGSKHYPAAAAAQATGLK